MSILQINFIFGKRSKKDPRIAKINRLIKKMEVNLQYFRTDKSRRYYLKIKELYKQLPSDLKQERKVITSNLERILNQYKEAFSTIPKSNFLTNSWTINIKEFIEPTKTKVMGVLFALLLTNLPLFIFNSTITGYASNPILYSSFTSNPASWKLLGTAVFISTSVIYWYLLICLILFIIKKVKK